VVAEKAEQWAVLQVQAPGRHHVLTSVGSPLAAIARRMQGAVMQAQVLLLPPPPAHLPVVLQLQQGMPAG
jgi:hypothetical protein